MTFHEELRAVAIDLYAGPLAEFTRARDEHAKNVADRDLGAAIRALRKPSIAAWVVNVFAQERPAELGEALQLAQDLREAQADLDAPALAKLGRERRALTRQLAIRAGQLAEARGEKVTSGTMDAVAQTIGAAFFVEAASVAVASGLLVRELDSSAEIDLDDAVAGGAPAARNGEPAPPADELADRRRRRRAEREVREAEEAFATANRGRDAAVTAADAAARRIDDLEAEVLARERELAHARQERERAVAAASSAKERADEAERLIAASDRALSTARSALDALP